MTKKLLMGNEAMAHAALEAGVGVVAGYPGTPSSEIVETVARQHRRGAAHGVHVEWSTNEKVALELLFGASLAGKRGLFTCKQMGLNVASDALMSLNYVSVRAGLVLIVADDPGPISSQTEQDTRRFAAFAKVPVLDPASPEQAFEMVKAAFDLSERFRTPVIVRPTTRVDHASAFIDVREETNARTPIAAMSGPILGLVNRGEGSAAAAGAGSAAAGSAAAAAAGASSGALAKPSITASPSPAASGPVAYGSGAMPSLATGFVHDPDRWVIFPRRAYEAHGEINDRLVQVAHVFATNPTFSQFNPIDEVEATAAPQRHARAHARASAQLADPGVTFGILASGISAAYTREALRAVAKSAATAGVRMPAYRFMQVGTPYPFPEAAVAQFTKGLADILVIEELDYVLEDELTRFAGRTHASFNVHGKLTGEARDRGENDVDDIITRLERFLGLTGRLSLFRLRDETRNATFGDQPSNGVMPVALDEDAEDQLPARPPVLCAGCPHRASFYAVKTALGDTPAVMCGDIGCYTLGNAKPLETIDTCLCMGGGITMAQGIAVADPEKKAIAYVGDSTFFASGLTGLANAAYNNHDITVMVLDNSTTAMTGAQPHPGTGETLMGEYSEPLDYETSLVACGITHVYHANPLDLKASIVAVRAAVSYEGPSAVVFSSPCAQLVPPDPPTLVNRDVCTGCRRCITSIGCPALTFNKKVNGPRSHERGQAVVDASLCVGCNLCVQVCPFKAIIPGEVVAKRKATETTLMPEGKVEGKAATTWPPYSADAMPEPKPGEEGEEREVPTGMRASVEAHAAVEAFTSPIKSGAFKPVPTFVNPWAAGNTESFPVVDVIEPEDVPVAGGGTAPEGESEAAARVEPDGEPAVGVEPEGEAAEAAEAAEVAEAAEAAEAVAPGEASDAEPDAEPDAASDAVPGAMPGVEFETAPEAEADADLEREAKPGIEVDAEFELVDDSASDGAPVSERSQGSQDSQDSEGDGGDLRDVEELDVAFADDSDETAGGEAAKARPERAKEPELVEAEFEVVADEAPAVDSDSDSAPEPAHPTTIQEQLPDFGIAAEFEDELEAEE